MALYKRRIVHLSDAEWEQLRTRSKKQGVSISALVRFLLVERDSPELPLPMRETVRTVEAPPEPYPQKVASNPIARMSQKDRDALLRGARK